jgi:hypothetical protein
LNRYLKSWPTTLAGVGALLGGLYDFYNTKALNTNNILAFVTGYGLINSESVQKKKKIKTQA